MANGDFWYSREEKRITRCSSAKVNFFRVWHVAAVGLYYTPRRNEGNRIFRSKRTFSSLCLLNSAAKWFRNDKALASCVFKLKELNTEYKILAEKLKELQINTKSVKKGELRKRFYRFWEDYKELLMLDPHLPAELLPDRWLGDEVREEFKRLTKIVLRN